MSTFNKRKGSDDNRPKNSTHARYASHGNNSSLTPFLENPTFDLNAVATIPSKSRQGLAVIATKSTEFNRPKTSTGFRGGSNNVDDQKSGVQGSTHQNKKNMQTLEEKATHQQLMGPTLKQS